MRADPGTAGTARRHATPRASKSRPDHAPSSRSYAAMGGHRSEQCCEPSAARSAAAPAPDPSAADRVERRSARRPCRQRWRAGRPACRREADPGPAQRRDLRRARRSTVSSAGLGNAAASACSSRPSPRPSRITRRGRVDDRHRAGRRRGDESHRHPAARTRSAASTTSMSGTAQERWQGSNEGRPGRTPRPISRPHDRPGVSRRNRSPPPPPPPPPPTATANGPAAAVATAVPVAAEAAGLALARGHQHRQHRRRAGGVDAEATQRLASLQARGLIVGRALRRRRAGIRVEFARHVCPLHVMNSPSVRVDVNGRYAKPTGRKSGSGSSRYPDTRVVPCRVPVWHVARRPCVATAA